MAITIKGSPGYYKPARRFCELLRGELVAIAVRELKLERKLRVVYRKGGQLSHAARAFLQVAESISGKLKGRYLFQTDK